MKMALQCRQVEAETVEFCGLTANALKMIAVFAMAVQHFTIKFMSSQSSAYFLLVALGKVTAPVMCFFIAEGFYYTRNRKRYLVRLFLFALLSHVPHALAFGFPVWKFWKYTSVMWSLTLGLAALMIYDHKSWNKWLRAFGILTCCLLSYPGNWNCVAVIWILGFGIFRNDPVKKWSVFLLGIGINIVEFFVIENDGFLLSNLAFLLPVLLLCTYNGQRGQNSRWIRNFFYWFYPVHLLFIYVIQILFV